MWIKVLKGCVGQKPGGQSFRFSRGVYDTDTWTALMLIRGGIAEKADTPDTPTALPDDKEAEVQQVREVRTTVIKHRRRRV